jgi:hypothetical protein
MEKYFFEGFGIVVGIVVGVIITMATDYAKEKLNETRKIKNFKFEINFNLSKINRWLEQIIKYRNAVNGDALKHFYEYFDLGRFVNVTANDLFSTGLMYKHLSDDDIGKLQILYNEFTPAWESLINQQINNYKMVAADPQQWHNQKTDAVSHVDFWESKFKEHKKTLESILKILK